MRFIRAIRLKTFRSLASVSVTDLDNIVPIVGPNGSGKSNLLRALNLFFNREVERGVPLDLSRDFYDPAMRSKAKKLVEVEADLHFGPSLRADLQQSITRLGGGADVITVRKRWSFDQTYQPTEEVAAGPVGRDLEILGHEQRVHVDRLLGAIRFRYISNHIHPTELLRDEEAAIRRLLLQRLGRRPGFTSEQIDRIRQAAESLMRDVTSQLQGTSIRVARVELGTPRDWSELLWAFGLRVQRSGTASREVNLHGSGTQAALAYAVLRLLDTSLGTDFGWRRGAVWAVEEPESFLHADLQAQLAESFSRYSQSDRLQILFTTHNTAFLGVANTGLAVGLDGVASAVTHAARADLIEMAMSSGVTPYIHPLHVGTIKPLLVVEGRFDRDVIKLAYELSDETSPYDIVAMEDLDASMTGGIEQILVYFNNNRSPLRARPPGSPVIVLLDHEVPDGRRSAIQRALDEHPTSGSFIMQKEMRTPGLKDDIPGIEAYLSLDFYREAESAIELPLIRPGSATKTSWSIGVERAALEQHKQDIHRLIAARRNPGDLVRLIELLPWISGLVRSR